MLVPSNTTAACGPNSNVPLFINFGPFDATQTACEVRGFTVTAKVSGLMAKQNKLPALPSHKGTFAQLPSLGVDCGGDVNVQVPSSRALLPENLVERSVQRSVMVPHTFLP